MKIPDAFAPFRSRNYRLFYSGHAISLTGSWMTQTAIGWLVYVLTGSTTMSGVAMFLSQVSHFFVTPVAGVMIDRVNRRSMLLAVQFGALSVAIGLALFQIFDQNLATLAIVQLLRCFHNGNSFTSSVFPELPASGRCRILPSPFPVLPQSILCPLGCVGYRKLLHECCLL